MWRRISDEAVKSCRQHLTPDKGKQKKRERRGRGCLYDKSYIKY